jgi:hypothetical protein
MRIGWALWLAAAAAQAAEWQSLFDGHSTAGWVEVTGKPFPAESWQIEGGCLKALVTGGGFQDIRTVEEFRSFELEFEWKIARGGNSGVKYLLEKVDEWSNKAGRQARARGYEFQISDDSPAAPPTRRAGALYGLQAPARSAVRPAGEFNQARIVVRGGRIEHWLNGERVVELQIGAEPKRATPVALQNHSSNAWFRQLRIRKLE